MLPLHYLYSFLFKVPSEGYMSSLYFDLAMGVVTFMVMQAFGSLQSKGFRLIADLSQWALIAFPHHGLCYGIKNMHKVSATRSMCKNMIEKCIRSMQDHNLKQCQDLACDYTSECCGKH